MALNDGFGGATPGGGVLTFANLAKLGTAGNALSNLLVVTEDAALNVNLPVQVLGQNLGPIALQIGNLFNTTAVTGLPARTVHTSFPNFSGISVGSILNDPQTVIDGLDAFLSTLAGGPFAQQNLRSGPAADRPGAARHRQLLLDAAQRRHRHAAIAAQQFHRRSSRPAGQHGRTSSPPG